MLMRIMTSFLTNIKLTGYFFFLFSSMITMQIAATTENQLATSQPIMVVPNAIHTTVINNGINSNKTTIVSPPFY